MDDLISRQAVIDAFDKAPFGYLPDKWMSIKTLEGLPPAQPEPQWIPVSERVPEESGYYIATIHFPLNGVGRRTTFVKYQKKAKSWELTGARSFWRVIAWMPLPEAYKPNK